MKLYADFPSVRAHSKPTKVAAIVFVFLSPRLDMFLVFIYTHVV